MSTRPWVPILDHRSPCPAYTHDLDSPYLHNQALDAYILPPPECHEETHSTHLAILGSTPWTPQEIEQVEL
jgi:hypothetical protein